MMKFKVGDKIIFNQDCRLAFSYIPTGKTGEITDIVDTGLAIHYRIKMQDYPNATVPTEKADEVCTKINPQNEKHNILNGLTQTDDALTEKLESQNDLVNHPSHYTDGKIEVIDFIEDKKLGYHLGNACKYISRCQLKNDGRDKVQDLRKAIWYIERQIHLWEG